MNRRKHRRMFRKAFCVAGADKVLLGYLAIFLISSLLILLIEPSVESFGDSVWYCFAVATTVGFGDIAAVSTAGRIITVLLSLYSIAALAIITAVITNYFMEISKARASESAREFLDDLQHLSEMSKEELDALSERVKQFAKE